MSSKNKPLTTDRQIAALKPSTKPVKHALGDKLYIRVTPDGRKYWYFRYKMPSDRNQREYGLGSYPMLSLSDARQIARQWSLRVAQGISPVVERQRQRAEALAASTPRTLSKTFRECADECHRDLRSTWKPETAKQWLRTLEIYAYPIIGNIAIDAITTDHVMQVLQPIWTTKADTASKVRQRIERVLTWAKAKKLRSGYDNPASWRENIEPLVGSLAAAKQNIRDRSGNSDPHFRALPYKDIILFVETLRNSQFYAKSALEFYILTMTRRANAAQAEWSEIDFDKRVWTIPAEKMKGRKGKGIEHRVPLCNATIALLRRQQHIQRNNSSRFVFPGRGAARDVSRPISKNALTKLVHQLGYNETTTIHGLRATFRTWGAEETNYDMEVLERVLAHTTNNAVVAAYDRGDRFQSRRQVMDHWAKFVLGELTGKVIEFPGSN